MAPTAITSGSATMHDTADIFGFNYDGSWGTSGLDVWQHHDHGRMSVEVARGAELFPEWNTARWWLSHEAYIRDPRRFLANLDAGLDVFASHGIGVMPVLFNRWRDPVCDFGGVPFDHLIPWSSAWTRADDLFADAEGAGPERALVERLFADYLDTVVGAHAGDERVVAWDLCNEPLMGAYVDDPDSPLRTAEVTWLTWVAARTRLAGARQPLTIGNYAGSTAIRLTEPLCDVIAFHPYFMWNGNPAQPHMSSREGFEAFLDEIAGFADSVGKGLVANETVWGAVDDATRVEVLRYTLAELQRRRIGFVVHALQHGLVADLHRPEWGPVGEAGAMHFIEADGTLRPGHDAIREFAPGRRVG
jgi:hypothetical protein